jgi:hypothetical protein
MQRLALRLHHQSQVLQPAKPLPVFWPGILPRNIAFLVIVLIHGFARLLPR